MKCKICKEREAVCKHHTKFDKETNKSDKDSPIQNLCCLCHCKIHGIEPRRGELRRLVVLYTRTQKARVAIENQIRSFSRIELKVPDKFNELLDDLKNEEKLYSKEIKKLLEGKGEKTSVIMKPNEIVSSPYPIYNWLRNIKGLGHLMSAKLISMIDIKNTPTISSLWRFCGLDPTHIKRRKGISKEEAKKHGNPELKSYMFQLGDLFIKNKVVYKKVYDKEKKRQIMLMEEKDQGDNETYSPFVSPPKSLMHCHMRAIRKMVKKFLKDLWLEWRKVEGLKISKKYLLSKKKIIKK